VRVQREQSEHERLDPEADEGPTPVHERPQISTKHADAPVSKVYDSGPKVYDFAEGRVTASK
jgi:hypothetical protein